MADVFDRSQGSARAIVTCIGADVRPASGDRQDGRIAACFSHAAHLRLEDGRLLSLLPGERQQGMRVMNIAVDYWSSLQAELYPGNTVVLKRSALSFAALSLPLAEVPRWNTRPAASCLPLARLDRNRLAQGFAWLVLALKSRRLEQDLVWRTAYRRFDLVVAALDAPESQLDAAVHATIGLGPGLTPSGDDLLTGALIGLDVAGRTTERTKLAACITRYAAETSEVSRDSLLQACSGWLNACITDVLLALTAPTGVPEAGPDALNRALSVQCEIGHYSGLDVLLGLFAVLKRLFRSAPFVSTTTHFLETN